MKKLITLTLLLAFYTGLFAQIRLDVEGDAKIVGKLELDSGDGNIFVGKDVGKANTIGHSNAFFGRTAGFNNTEGSLNAFFGRSAGFKNTTGSYNAFFGMYAGLHNTEGSYNAFFGMYAGDVEKKSTRSTMLGYDAQALISGDSIDRAIAIGYESRVRCHNCAVIGGTAENAVKVGIGTDTPLTDLHIKQSYGTGGITLEPANGTDQWKIHHNGANINIVEINGGTSSLRASIQATTGMYVHYGGNFTNPNNSESRNSQIQSMDKVLAKVKRLQPTTKKISNGRNSSKIWGFAAEEVAKIFPEITPEQDGQKGIIYDYFGILSIKAIQELAVEVEMQVAENNSLKEAHKIQNEQIANQQEQLETQQEQIDELKSLVEQLLTQNAGTPKSTSHVLPLEQNALLAQNHPNPFRENTLVDYFVPANVQHAHIQVTGLDGKVLGQVKIAEKGKGQVTIQSKSYPAGTYFYSLVLDGQVMETKQMVLTR